MATLKGKGSTGARCRHSLTSLPLWPACAPDGDRQPRTSGREVLGELSVTERCNRLVLLVTSPLILADRCEECPRLLGKGYRLILLPDDPARAFNHKQLPPSWRSGSKKLDGSDEKGEGRLHAVYMLEHLDQPLTARWAARARWGRRAMICNLRSESCGWRATCYLTPPALACRVSPPLCRADWQPSEAATRREKSPKSHLDKSCLLLTSSDFFVIQPVFKSPAWQNIYFT